MGMKLNNNCRLSIDNVLCCYIYLLKNSVAVKKGAALFKMASVKKVVKSKGAAKKWLWPCRLMGKFLITTIQINLCCLILASPGISTKFTWIVVIKIFPSTYTITAIFFLGHPLWFDNFFHTGCFWADITSFCNIFTRFRCKQLARLPPSINTIMTKPCYSTQLII